MARIREFNPEEALDKAMHVFWNKGYRHTSMINLVEATGVGKKGLYTVFGNKKQLYMKALEHYKCLQADKLLANLEQFGSSLYELKYLFNEALVFSQTETGRKGCMVGNAIVEFGGKEPEIKKATDKHLERFRVAIFNALSNARENNEIDESIDIGRHSNFFCSVILSLMVMSRAGTDYKIMKDTVDSTLRTLE